MGARLPRAFGAGVGAGAAAETGAGRGADSPSLGPLPPSLSAGGGGLVAGRERARDPLGPGTQN